MKIHEDIEKTLEKDYIEYDLGAWGKARVQRLPLMDHDPYVPITINWGERSTYIHPFTIQTQDNGTT